MKFLLLLFFLGLLMSCNQQSTSDATNEGQENSPTSQYDLTDFYQFYQNFHKDSLYQTNHISWPLEGLPNNAPDSILRGEVKFHWKQESWSMHQPFDFETSQYERKMLPMSEDLVTEYILSKDGKMGMVRRFAKVSDEWYLIYYGGMNFLVSNN